MRPKMPRSQPSISTSTDAMNLADVTIRPLKPEDSIEELTLLLHRAYKRLADMGLNYLATYQDSATTQKRVDRGQCFVAVYNGRIIGTINFYNSDAIGGSAWLERDDVAEFGQFGIEPKYQKCGLGSHMVAFVENHARELGVKELALNTSENAGHLIAWYEKLGYRFIEYVDWAITNYRSVVMSKTL